MAHVDSEVLNFYFCLRTALSNSERSKIQIKLNTPDGDNFLSALMVEFVKYDMVFIRVLYKSAQKGHRVKCTVHICV